jgi:hypothetical protein
LRWWNENLVFKSEGYMSPSRGDWMMRQRVSRRQFTNWGSSEEAALRERELATPR